MAVCLTDISWNDNTLSTPITTSLPYLSRYLGRQVAKRQGHERPDGILSAFLGYTHQD